MHSLFRAAVTALVAVFGFGVFALAQSAVAGADDDLVAKREDTVSVLATDEDPDDEPDDDTEDGHEPDDDATGVSNDGTGSGHTRVSQDRDVSNGDLTRDRTMDGGDPTRDHTQNHTNDGTRNDTR